MTSKIQASSAKTHLLKQRTRISLTTSRDPNGSGDYVRSGVLYLVSSGKFLQSVALKRFMNKTEENISSGQRLGQVRGQTI